MNQYGLYNVIFNIFIQLLTLGYLIKYKPNKSKINQIRDVFTEILFLIYFITTLFLCKKEVKAS